MQNELQTLDEPRRSGALCAYYWSVESTVSASNILLFATIRGKFQFATSSPLDNGSFRL